MKQRILRHGLIAAGIAGLLLIAVDGVVAATPQEVIPHTGTLLQSDPGFICDGNGNATFLGSVIDSLLSFLFVTGIPVFVLLYQLDGILEFFALGADTKAKIKKHERNLWLGAAKIYIAPVILKLLAVDVLGLSLVSCITLLPGSLGG